MQALGNQRMREAEHQRDIGAGPDRMPESGQVFRQIVAQRPDQMKLDAALSRRAEPLAGDMPARAAAADIVVLQCHAAEGEDQRALRDQLVPAHIVTGDGALRADHMRQDHRGGARAIAADRADIAAEKVQKAVELVLRVVKPAGAGPAVGPAEHVMRSVPRIDASQLRGETV